MARWERHWRESGFTVITCLEGRSARTKSLAQEAGITDAGSLDAFVTSSDIVLSILVPSQAEQVAGAVAESIRRVGKRLPFADCNAISPHTSIGIGGEISEAGGRSIDCGIVGSPPGTGDTPRFYASGEHAGTMEELDGKGIIIKNIGGTIGKASAVKMCYASVTKGTAALHAAALVAAVRMGMYEEFIEELQFSQRATLERMEGVISLSAKAFRWVGEMEEIASTFESVGVSPLLHSGAAETFQMVTDSLIGSERPETVDTSRTVKDTVEIFAESLKNNKI